MKFGSSYLTQSFKKLKTILVTRYGRAIIKMFPRGSSLAIVTRKIGGNVNKHYGTKKSRIASSSRRALPKIHARSRANARNRSFADITRQFFNADHPGVRSRAVHRDMLQFSVAHRSAYEFRVGVGADLRSPPDLEGHASRKTNCGKTIRVPERGWA